MSLALSAAEWRAASSDAIFIKTSPVSSPFVLCLDVGGLRWSKKSPSEARSVWSSVEST